MEFSITDHLIIPFGVEKWKIEDIRIVGVSTSETYFKTDIPVVHIEKRLAKPYRIGSYCNRDDVNLQGNTLEEYIDSLCRHIKNYCDSRSGFESKFVDVYFSYLKGYFLGPGSIPMRPSGSDFPGELRIFSAPMIIPQAHLYVTDTLRDSGTFVPERMVKVDFAFWTGTNFVAVEVDGSSHVGNEKHVWKDRWLQRAGVQVIHVLNDEINQFGTKIISSLLPNSIGYYWTDMKPDELKSNVPFMWSSSFDI